MGKILANIIFGDHWTLMSTLTRTVIESEVVEYAMHILPYYMKNTYFIRGGPNLFFFKQKQVFFRLFNFNF